MEVAENYVRLMEGIPKRLHFIEHKWVKKRIKDPETGWEKDVNALIFRVDWEDGLKVDKSFSVISTKLQQMFLPYLADNLYKRYIFTIIKHGAGYVTEFELRTEPWVLGT